MSKDSEGSGTRGSLKGEVPFTYKHYDESNLLDKDPYAEGYTFVEAAAASKGENKVVSINQNKNRKVREVRKSLDLDNQAHDNPIPDNGVEPTDNVVTSASFAADKADYDQEKSMPEPNKTPGPEGPWLPPKLTK
ncbi:MAG: hypothetical protein VX335_02980 [Pseudomonadota bacterium]|nr:hypothetical protein [Pseudomonadota bacterium]